MIYYLDTEFIEFPRTIDLISVALLREDGLDFYAENFDVNLKKANKFVKKNVIPNTKWIKNPYVASFATDTRAYADIYVIKEKILNFIGRDHPEFWGYFADYDWVIFCWLFGCMVDLPKGWPMYCRDLRQLADALGKRHGPKENETHNALDDVYWNRDFHRYLKEGTTDAGKSRELFYLTI